VSDRPQIGFVGLGNLGRHLAASLLREGFPLVVHDLDPAAADQLIAAGASWAESPRALAAESDSVVTCLPSPDAVVAVVAGRDGILEGLRPGGVWIDSSTNDRHTIEHLAQLARARDVDCLEAPVTGGVHLAASGEITVLVGGDEAVVEGQRAVLDAIGGEVIYVGPLGSASAIKVITNMLAFVNLVSLGEALMVARRAGADLTRVFHAIRASSGNSFVHETEGQLILNGSYNVGFTIDLACKDLRLVRELGRELGVPLELTALVEQTFIRARAQYGGPAWSTMVVKLLEDALGTDLRAPGFPASLH
jgi:3-hydroxyisobutyrate dehydrogenase